MQKQLIHASMLASTQRVLLHVAVSVCLSDCMSLQVYVRIILSSERSTRMFQKLENDKLAAPTIAASVSVSVVGYKVYWRSGHQITPPHDRGIARCIEDNLQPWRHYDTTTVTDHPLCADRTAELEASYFEALRSRLCTQERRYLPYTLQSFEFKTVSHALPVWNTPTEPSVLTRCRHNRTALAVVYSGMHGVGAPFVAAAFDAFGLPPYIPVAEQCGMAQWSLGQLE